MAKVKHKPQLTAAERRAGREWVKKNLRKYLRYGAG
jgi:hypothetical protein